MKRMNSRHVAVSLVSKVKLGLLRPYRTGKAHHPIPGLCVSLRRWRRLLLRFLVFVELQVKQGLLEVVRMPQSSSTGMHHGQGQVPGPMFGGQRPLSPSGDEARSQQEHELQRSVATTANRSNRCPSHRSRSWKHGTTPWCMSSTRSTRRRRRPSRARSPGGRQPIFCVSSRVHAAKVQDKCQTFPICDGDGSEEQSGVQASVQTAGLLIRPAHTRRGHNGGGGRGRTRNGPIIPIGAEDIGMATLETEVLAQNCHLCNQV